MLLSSVSCCKRRPSVLVPMRAGRAKPRPPTRGRGAGRQRRCGEEAQARAVLLWKRRGESSGRPRRDGRRAGVEEAKASHPSSVGNGSEAGGSDASTGNGAGAGARESERTGQSSCERLDGRRSPDVQALVSPNLT